LDFCQGNIRTCGRRTGAFSDGFLLPLDGRVASNPTYEHGTQVGGRGQEDPRLRRLAGTAPGLVWRLFVVLTNSGLWERRGNNFSEAREGCEQLFLGLKKLSLSFLEGPQRLRGRSIAISFFYLL
jgi:hypothetical protein